MPEATTSPEPTKQRLSELTLANIEELRARQLEVFRHADRERLSHGSGETDQTTIDYDEIIDAYLDDLHLSEDNPDRAEIRRIFRDYSIDNVRVDEWHAGPYKTDDAGNPTLDLEEGGISRFNNLVADYDKEAPENPEEVETGEVLADKAKAKHEAFVNLITKMKAFSEDKDARNQYKEALAAYKEELIQLAKTILEQDGGSHETLAQKMQEIAQQDADEEQRIFMEQGNKLTRWVKKQAKKYADLSGGKRLAVGAGLALPLVAAGAITGVSLAAAGVAGAAGLGAWRASRGYLSGLSGLYSEKMRRIGKFEYSNGNSIDDSMAVDQMVDRVEESSDSRVVEAKKVRRRAVKMSMGAVAVGAVASEAVSAVSDGENSRLGKAAEWVKDRFSGDEVGAADGAETPDSDSPRGTYGEEPYNRSTSDPTLNPGDGSESQDKPGTGTTETPAEQVHSVEAETIKAGEGWYQTFKEMGVPKEHWNELLNKAGPGLVDMGIGYPDSDIGGYGIYMTSDGQMPQEALDYINNVATQEGYLDASSATVPAEPGATITPAEPGAESAASHEIDPNNKAQIEYHERISDQPVEHVDPSDIWSETHDSADSADSQAVTSENKMGLALSGSELATAVGVGAAAGIGYSEASRRSSTPEGYSDMLSYDARGVRKELIRLVGRVPKRWQAVLKNASAYVPSGTIVKNNGIYSVKKSGGKVPDELRKALEKAAAEVNGNDESMQKAA